MNSADAKLIHGFRSCELPSLSHEEHVRLAWIVLQDQSLLPAIETLRQGFRAFAQAKGKPEIFHETITWAFTVLIHERIEFSRVWLDLLFIAFPSIDRFAIDRFADLLVACCRNRVLKLCSPFLV